MYSYYFLISTCCAAIFYVLILNPSVYSLNTSPHLYTTLLLQYYTSFQFSIFSTSNNFPIIQLSNFLVINQSIWLSSFWLSCYLAYLALWLSGWTLSSGWLDPLVALFPFPPVTIPSTCCSSCLHLLLLLFPLVSHPFSTC